MSPELRRIKEDFNITLIGFENAVITLPPYCNLHYFGPYSNLMTELGNFYSEELKKQKFNIIFTMDALGDIRGFATEVKDSIQVLDTLFKQS